MVEMYNDLKLLQFATILILIQWSKSKIVVYIIYTYVIYIKYNLEPFCDTKTHVCLVPCHIKKIIKMKKT